MSEEVTIVNEKDEIIGSAKRGTLLPEDIYRVSSLWVENEFGEILLAKRALSKNKDPGLWGPAVAGTVDNGETYQENIIRESFEELGLKNTFPKKWVKQRVRKPHNHFTQWFKLKIKKEISLKIQKEEVDKIKWFDQDELFGLVKKDSPEMIDSLKIFIREEVMR